MNDEWDRNDPYICRKCEQEIPLSETPMLKYAVDPLRDNICAACISAEEQMKKINPRFDENGVGFCSEEDCSYAVQTDGPLGILWHYCEHPYLSANAANPKGVCRSYVCYPWLISSIGTLQKGCLVLKEIDPKEEKNYD